MSGWNWTMILLGIISFELSSLIFISLNNQPINIIFINKSLELILTINGLFSAILITYFINRVTWILNTKKDIYLEAITFSQKITEFRRICDKLTQYYGVWTDDKAAKSLLESSEYRHIEYYEYRMLYKSDYKPKKNDLEAIEKLRKDSRFKEGISDLYLGMVSIVKNRKSGDARRPSELYKDFQKKGIYYMKYIEKVVESECISYLWYWFDNDYNFINYSSLSKDSKSYILKAFERIDTKYKNVELNNEIMAELFDDMNEYYYKELYKLLLILRKGLSNLDLTIFLLLIASLIFGVLIPFYTYFILNNPELKSLITKIIIGINFGLLFFFITNLYGLIKKEIIWI